MKFNTSILIVILILSFAAECIGGSSFIEVVVKGNVQMIDYHDQSYPCRPVKNAKIAVFIDIDESKISKNYDTTSWYITDKNGDFKSIKYVLPCEYIRNRKSSLEYNKCIPDRIELIVRHDDNIKDRTKRLIYYKADLNIIQDEDGVLILELPVVDLTENNFGLHCGNKKNII